MHKEEIIEDQTEETEHEKNGDIKIAIPASLIDQARALVDVTVDGMKRTRGLKARSGRQTVILALQDFIQSKEVISDLRKQLREREKTVALYQIQDRDIDSKRLLKEASELYKNAQLMMEEIKSIQESQKKQ